MQSKKDWANHLKRMDMKCHSCKSSWYYLDWKEDKCPHCSAKIYADSFIDADLNINDALIGFGKEVVKVLKLKEVLDMFQARFFKGK